MCNKEVHELLIQEGQVNCIFCNEQIQDPGKPERDFCCDSLRLIKDNFLVCKNCGQVHDYLIADEYVDFGRMEKPESGIRNRSRKRKRKRKRNLN